MAQSQAAPPHSAGRSDTSAESIGWPHRVTLWLLLAAGVALRVFHLAWKPFWFDECFSAEIARIDWRDFLHLLWWREANMSFYYVLLRVWMHFGQSPFFIRSLSVAASAATLPAVYWVGRMLYNRRVALIAAALFAFNAYSIRYAQEARSYSLLVLLATLSSGFLIAWLQRPTRRSWIGYILASTLAVYAHFYALLLLLAHAAATRGLSSPNKSADDRGMARQLRRARIAIGAAVSPLLIFVAKTGAGPIRWIQRPGLHDLLEFSKNMAGGNFWLLLILSVACLAALGGSGKDMPARPAKWGLNWNAWRGQFLLVWLLLPVALTVLLSFARPVFLPRYMIFCLPALAILAAAGLAKLRQPWLLAPALACVLLLAWQGTTFVYEHDFDDDRDASGAATDFILEHSQPGDAIVFHIAATRVPYEFFRALHEEFARGGFAGNSSPDILFPHHGPSLDYRDFTGKPTPEIIESAAPGYSRVWVMLMYNGTAQNGNVEKPDATTQMLTQVLPQSFPKTERWQFAKVEVRLYSRQ